MDVLVYDALSKLEYMCKNGSLRTDYEYIFECIISWGYEEKLLGLIQRYHDVNARKDEEPKNKKQKVTRNDDVHPKTKTKQAIVALALLNCALRNKQFCSFLMKSKKILDSILIYQYNTISEELVNFIKTNKEKEDVDRETYEMHLSMTLHTHAMLITHQALQPLQTKKFEKKKKKDQDKFFVKVSTLLYSPFLLLPFFNNASRLTFHLIDSVHRADKHSKFVRTIYTLRDSCHNGEL